jgi:hypothetical protein
LWRNLPAPVRNRAGIQRFFKASALGYLLSKEGDSRQPEMKYKSMHFLPLLITNGNH